jgi:hypothetical protein
MINVFCVQPNSALQLEAARVPVAAESSHWNQQKKQKLGHMIQIAVFSLLDFGRVTQT